MTRLVPFRGEQEDIRLTIENEEGQSWIDEWDFERKQDPEPTEVECAAIDKWLDDNINDIMDDYWNSLGDYD